MQLYGPTVYLWARQAAIQPADAADVVQEIFSAVALHIQTFRREQPEDNFRGWLWTISRNKIRDHFRRCSKQVPARGGTEAYRQINQIPSGAEPSSSNNAIPRDESGLMQRALESIRASFEATTWKAFWRTTVDRCTASDVADELALSRAAVYQAKSRVLRRIRQEFGEILV